MKPWQADEFLQFVVNQSKTKFMAILGSEEDKKAIDMCEYVVHHCDIYVYLGAIFSSDASTVSSLKAYIKEKKYELNKLIVFLATN